MDDCSSTVTTRTTQHEGSGKSTIADIGTDHGLLAVGLALTGRFEKVIGVDVSDLALKDGGLALLGHVHNLGLRQTQDANPNAGSSDPYDWEGPSELPIEFRLGNGLKVLEKGDANCICIAGMGVHRMLAILGCTDMEGLPDGDGDRITDIARIGCRQLILQPTNSRPSNLILLYDKLQRDGWRLTDERIEKVSSRWYITASFRRQIMTDDVGATKGNSTPSRWDLPGSKLQDSVGSCESRRMRSVSGDYIRFHKHWIQQDAIRSRQPFDPNDKRWLDYFAEEKICKQSNSSCE
jgi:tRNA A22 N-methylase